MLQEFGYSPSVIVSHFGAFTTLGISLAQMKPELLKSKLVRDILNGRGNPELHCTVSYQINGRLVNSESYMCNLFSEIYSSDIVIFANVDYGLSKCNLSGDLSCQKAEVKRAASFLKGIKKESDEIFIEIRFQEEVVLAGKLDMSTFKLESVNEFLKHIDFLPE